MIRKLERAKDKITDAVESREGIDIYQMCAFLSRHARYLNSTEAEEEALVTQQSTHEEHERNDSIRFSSKFLDYKLNRKSRIKIWEYYLCVGKALLSAVVQIWSFVLAINELVDQYHSEVCKGTFDFSSVTRTSKKIVYAGFAMMIGLNVLNGVNAVNICGLYNAIVDEKCILPDLCSEGWLLLGRTINYLVLLSACWSSFMIIYLSGDLLGMIENCVAVYFVLELDNMVMSHYEYKRLAVYIDAFDWDLEERAKVLVDPKNAPQESKGVLNYLLYILTWLLSTSIVKPFVYVTAFTAFFFIPVFFLWCL